MLNGDLVVLCAIEREDLPQLQSWRNDSEIRRYFREFRDLSMDQQERWYENTVNNNPDTLMYAIHRKKDNELIGCCGFNHVNWIHRRAELSLYIGWESSYIDEVGYAKESIVLLLDYGFRELGIQRIWTETYSFDVKKRKLAGEVGFSEDGLLRNNYFFEGKWWDSIVISILSGDYLGIDGA